MDHRKSRALVAAAALVLTLGLPGAQGASASGGDNLLTIVDTGSGNSLSVIQSDGGGHSATVSLSGEANGVGLSGAWGADFLTALPGLPDLTGATGLSAALEPGALVQTGWGHRLNLSVSGYDNRFAIGQAGTGNIVRGAITGSGNQALVLQAGHGSQVGFTQTGTRNSLSIRQASW